MEDLLQVGAITQTHGLRGEVKVFPTTDDAKRFKKLKEVIMDTGKEKMVLEIEGVKFYGVPMFMGDCMTDRQSRHYANIPDDTDVLITHSPAYGILDYDDGINYGSEEILSKISTLSLKAHLFGHIHARHGIKEQNGVIYSNGAIINADYTILSTPNIIIVENA